MEESHDDDGGLSAGCLMLDLLINNLMCMESAYGRRTRGTASTLTHTCVGEECLNLNHQPTNFSSSSNHCAKSHAPLEAFHLSILVYIQRLVVITLIIVRSNLISIEKRLDYQVIVSLALFFFCFFRVVLVKIIGLL